MLQWYSWKLDHEKFYQDSNQETMRRMIWYENYRLISQHNSAANHSYALELNEFADLVSVYISLVWCYNYICAYIIQSVTTILYC